MPVIHNNVTTHTFEIRCFLGILVAARKIPAAGYAKQYKKKVNKTRHSLP